MNSLNKSLIFITPDITRFKFTGQEEDKESGLMYYKARYYDPMVGRFLQADSVIMPTETFGMNRYMYVSGNPVRYGDDSGHKRHNGDQERQIEYLAAAAIGYQKGGILGAALGLASIPNAKYRSEEKAILGKNQKRPEKYNAKDALADVAHAFQRGMHDLNHFNDGALQDGAQWMIGGLQRAADTVNLFIFGRHHNENTLSHKIGRSDPGKFRQKRIEEQNALIYRNRHCIALGVAVVFFVLTWEAVMPAAVGGSGGGLAAGSFGGDVVSGGAGLFGVQAPSWLITSVNVIANTNNLVGTNVVSMVQGAQNCHMNSL